MALDTSGVNNPVATTQQADNTTVDDATTVDSIYRDDGTINTKDLNFNNRTANRTEDAVQAAKDYVASFSIGNAKTGDALTDTTNRLLKLNTRLVSLDTAFQSDPNNGDLAKAINKTINSIEQAKADAQIAQNNASAQLGMAQADLVTSAFTDPSSLIEKANVPKINTQRGLIGTGVGQAGPAATVDNVAQAGFTAASMPDQFSAATYQAALASPAMAGVVSSLQAEQGNMNPAALIEAITQDPNSLAQLNLVAAQIEQAQQVNTPEQLQMQDGEMLSGSVVDWAKVQEALDIQAAQADPSRKATVQGQLEDLMQTFEGGNPPAWAAGAIRQATADMLARGLGSSSMAGAAVVQAAMESAIPIAAADAQIHKEFELQNLSNRQAVVLLAAQQRAAFLGQEFDQEFQARVLNAARIGEIASTNYNAEVQIALENARMAQTVDLANLDAKNAKMMADAAAMTQLELANLSHRQQAAVANAQAFLTLDMANLENRQQTALMKAQLMSQAVLSDQAAENAALQFNASSENQVNMFFSDLAARVSMQNSQQANAISMFNAGQTNQVSMFNAQMVNQRQEFNATNRLVVAQANAQWRQNVQLARFSAKFEANMQAAKESNALTAATFDALMQRERDIMSYAFQFADNSADRAVQLLLGDKQLEGVRERTAADLALGQAQLKDNAATGLGSFLSDLALGWLL